MSCRRRSSATKPSIDRLALVRAEVEECREGCSRHAHYQESSAKLMMYESNYAAHYRIAGREPPEQLHDFDELALLAKFDSQRCYERTRLIINVDRKRCA